MALEGTLQDMSLSDLIQVFRMGPKSGVLLLREQIQHGIIYVSNGRMIDALILRGSERTIVATADEAVIQMLTWDNARFVFQHNPYVHTRPIRIHRDGEQLILEGMARRADPTRAIPYHSITLDTYLQLSPLPNNSGSGVKLNVHQWRILSQVASQKSLRDVCEATKMERTMAIRTVVELLSLGVIEVVAPPRPQKVRHPEKQAVATTARCDFGSDMQRDDASMTNGVHGFGTETKAPPVISHTLLNAIKRRIHAL